MTDDDAVSLAHHLISAHSDLQIRLLKSEALNAELARMLKSLEWSDSDEGAAMCPKCSVAQFGMDPVTFNFNKLNNHAPDCALAALLKKATTE